VQIHTCASQLQHLLLEYGVESISEVLVEGLSRVKRCTDEGRALMSLDLQVSISQFNCVTHSEANAMEESVVTGLMFFQVLINGLQHIVASNVRPKLQTVDTFIKVSRAKLVVASSYGTWLLSGWHVLTAQSRAFTTLQSLGDSP
jgi:hypothetical protein